MPPFVGLHVPAGSTVAIVGETGAGKTSTALAIMRLLPDRISAVPNGSVKIYGKEVRDIPEGQMRLLRGEIVSMIFQDPMTALNPVFTVGYQINESLLYHDRAKTKSEAKQKAIRLLKDMGIPLPEKRVDEYPYQFSGGMCQRAMIAMAMSCQPKVLIADEPTTALDVTIQAQIIDLMKQLQRELGAAIVLITHDLGVVAGIAKHICVMYSGKIVERGTSAELFYHPRHPYTWALLKAVPRLDLKNKQELATIEGTPPDLLSPPAGCPFCTRCRYCMPVCKEEMPPDTDFGGGHQAACWLHDPRAPKVDAPFVVRKEAGGI